MEQESLKMFLILKIIVFESGSTILIFSNRMLVIGSQYITKQP